MEIKYTDIEGLKYALQQFLAEIDTRYSDEGHNHTASEITDLNDAVNDILTGAGGTAHTHSNLTVLEKLTDVKLTTWDNKIGEDDVTRIKYTNAGMSTVTNVSGALDTFVTNISGIIGDINGINNETTGILAQAKTYTNNQIALQTHLSFSIVTDLPTENISSTVIYLKPITGGAEPNLYEEWIYIDSKWENIGTTKTDLTDYYTKTEIDGKISTINGNIDKKVDKVDGMGLSQESYTTTEKTKLANISTATNEEIDAIIGQIFPSN